MDTSAPSSAGRGPDNAGNAGASSTSSTSPHVPVLAPISTTASTGGQLLERSSSRSGSSARQSVSHRQSFAENLRSVPSSPRTQRPPSFTQAVQDLLSHPPPQRHPDPRFAGRDWRDVSLGDLVCEDDVKWAEMDTSVEDCTKILLKNSATRVVLLRESPSAKTAVSTFDYRDLNAYLLAVVGLATPEPEFADMFRSISQRAQAHVAIPIRDIQPLFCKEPAATLPSTQRLDGAIELFGSGVHRILVTSPSSPDVVGILTQLRLLEFFWNESVNFPAIDRLYPMTLRDLRIGTHEAISINADRPLAEALILINAEGLTSVAVVDNGMNVVGNISAADVEHLTSATSFPLLHSSCMNFISVILSKRGVEEGRDSFPVFYVYPHSTLAHTVAKLVATRSHRMWVVDHASSPAPSAPQTPLLAPVQASSSVSSTSGVSLLNPGADSSFSHVASTEAGEGAQLESPSVAIATSGNGVAGRRSLSPAPGSVLASVPIPSGGRAPSFGSVPAAAMPGAHLSDRLTSVISLTDILNLFAKTSGLRPSDPADIRARRRRSSSSSVRPSLDGLRPSFR